MVACRGYPQRHRSASTRLGSVGAYRAVRARGFRASKVLLYAIEGALLDVHWNELSPDHKAALLGELETFPVRNKS